MERRPLLSCGIASAMGAALSQPLAADIRALLLCALVVCAACLLMRRKKPGRLLLCIPLALLAGGASGMLHGGVARQAAVRAHTMRAVCTVIDDLPAADGSSAFTCLTSAGALLSVNASGNPPAIAEHILLRGRIEPFDGPRNPGEPDQAALARERGLSAHIGSARILGTLAPASPALPIVIARMHAWASAQLRARLAEPYASIAAGELWGERAALSPQLRYEFQETGTVHVLVTAGLHLGVVALLSMLLLRTASVPRIPACALTVTIVWAYAAVSGFHLPVLRAATMATFALSAYAAGRAPVSWSAYGCALLVFALCWPQDISSASFALSFSCVGSILLCADQFAHALDSFALPNRIKEVLVLTLATQIGTWPVTAAVFLLFAPYAILANLLVVPLVGVTMMLAGAQLLAAHIAALAQALANVNAWILAWIVSAVSTIASLPGAQVPMTPPPAWTIAAYDAALIFAVWCWKRGARTPAAAALALALSCVIAPPAHADTHLRITVLDVGQADGIVIQTPRGYTVLVDAGGRLERGGIGGQSSAENVGERIMVPFLRRTGIRRIDAIVLSHPHGDHAGGVAPVLRGFGVGEFADSGQRYGGYAYNDALQTARGEGVPVVYPRAGNVWRTDDGVVFTFIGPSLPLIASKNAINDNSVAFVLAYRHFRMLFTGDAGSAAEQRFLDEGIDLHADVLKVGHHGSAYGSTFAFIAAVHPRYAIISVGRHNMFGHPAPSTIQTLEDAGAMVYRTDQNGAVAIKTDGAPGNAGITPMLPGNLDDNRM